MDADAANEAALLKMYRDRDLLWEVMEAAGSPRVAAERAVIERVRAAAHIAAEEIRTAADADLESDEEIETFCFCINGVEQPP